LTERGADGNHGARELVDRWRGRMKFASFVHRGKQQVGLVDEAGERVYPLASVAGGMLDLIERYEELRAGLRREGDGVAFADVQWLAPIPAPRRNIFCVGKNYRDHAKEFAQSGFDATAVKGVTVDEYPAIFTKPASAVIGHGAPIRSHQGVTRQIDYEVELAVVIGTGGKGIRRQDAYRHVWGYTIINDVTARDLQKNHKQWFLGKSLDTFCPMGPWITTADEVDPENIEVKTWINGELRQSANTRDLIFDIPNLIETISAGITLLPGDIIATGTPAGVGIGFDPPKFLKPGDSVTMTISGIGTLANTLVE
jgi:2-keto-4-pentenoate hydratase/2-oxohepta-3-ene-1,7-dioic acid hydratase in catechol pathway